MNINELNDQELNRLEKLEKYRALGIDPFGQAYKVSHSIKEIRALCNKKSERGKNQSCNSRRPYQQKC